MEQTLQGVGFVAAGGSLGAIGRYAVDLLITIAYGDVTGLSTLLVNVIGSFVLGMVVVRALGPRTQLFVSTGFVSSFTTYSTFTTDVLALEGVAAAGYVTASYGLGFAAALAGLSVGASQ